jgi:hypothetical protein
MKARSLNSWVRALVATKRAFFERKIARLVTVQWGFVALKKLLFFPEQIGFSGKPNRQ